MIVYCCDLDEEDQITFFDQFVQKSISFQKGSHTFSCKCRWALAGKNILSTRQHGFMKDRHQTNLISFYDEVHHRDPSKTLYMGIDKYKPHWRGSSLVREISKQEMAWIYRLKTYSCNKKYVNPFEIIWISAQIGHKMWSDLHLSHNNRQSQSA